MESMDSARLQELIRQDAPDELWDVYDSDGRRTGRTHRRGEALREGEYHLCVHVWMRGADGRYLLTRRAPGKALAGLWETTGGSALAGEDSLSAALREVREETGVQLDPARGRRWLRFWGDRFLCDVWLFKQDIRPEDVVLQPGETCEARLADAETVRALAAAGEFFAFDYLEELLNTV